MNWKAIGIAFICISAIEALVIIQIFSAGYEYIENEAECANVECFDYDAFYYDIDTGVCQCYIDGEVEKSVKVGR